MLKTLSLFVFSLFSVLVHAKEAPLRPGQEFSIGSSVCIITHVPKTGMIEVLRDGKVDYVPRGTFSEPNCLQMSAVKAPVEVIQTAELESAGAQADR